MAEGQEQEQDQGPEIKPQMALQMGGECSVGYYPFHSKDQIVMEVEPS